MNDGTNTAATPPASEPSAKPFLLSPEAFHRLCEESSKETGRALREASEKRHRGEKLAER